MNANANVLRFPLRLDDATPRAPSPFSHAARATPLFDRAAEWGLLLSAATPVLGALWVMLG